MRIAALPPAMLQSLLAAASPKVERVVSDATAAEPQAAPPPNLPPAPQAAASVQMLVALAANMPAAERRRRMAESADRGLSMLERLHAELAAGAVAPERLVELAAWAESFEVPDDPVLAGLARDIEVRVRVEIAKHEVRA